MSRGRRNFNLLEWAIYLTERETRLRREHRPEALVVNEPALGCQGVPFETLLERTSSRQKSVRLQAAKCLGETADPEKITAAGEALVRLLQDEEHSVRRAAMNSLILLNREALRPLLEALTRDFQSARLRDGVHQVLHALYNLGDLNQAEAEVFRALEGVAPGIQAAWAANNALISGS